MTYGHAERTLATIRLLGAETMQLLNSEDHLDPEQERWLREAAESASRRVRGSDAAPPACRSGQPSAASRRNAEKAGPSRRLRIIAAAAPGVIAEVSISRS
jgi:hypothetical protein